MRQLKNYNGGLSKKVLKKQSVLYLTVAALVKDYVTTLKAYLLNICPLFLGSCFLPSEAKEFRWAKIFS